MALDRTALLQSVEQQQQQHVFGELPGKARADLCSSSELR